MISPELLSSLFPPFPSTLRDELIHEFLEITRNFRENRWEPSELNGGKFCEVVYTICEGFLTSTYPPNAKKPSDMVSACRNLERTQSSIVPRSIRIQIPRVLLALYEIRNNRGVGHVGGDVNSNHMDASYVLYSAKWVLGELIRIFHNVSVTQATEIVDSIVERVVPIVWEIDGKKRVLDEKLTFKEKTLLLLYNQPGFILENDLFDWVEHKRLANYRINVLIPLHDDKLIEYNRNKRIVFLSPKGVSFVETTLL